jgi:hypothetical protein
MEKIDFMYRGNVISCWVRKQSMLSAMNHFKGGEIPEIGNPEMYNVIQYMMGNKDLDDFDNQLEFAKWAIYYAGVKTTIERRMNLDDLLIVATGRTHASRVKRTSQNGLAGEVERFMRYNSSNLEGKILVKLQDHQLIINTNKCIGNVKINETYTWKIWPDSYNLIDGEIVCVDQNTGGDVSVSVSIEPDMGILIGYVHAIVQLLSVTS